MSKSQFVELLIPPRLPLSLISEFLAPEMPGSSPLQLQFDFHDSFDWRLFREGLCLSSVQSRSSDERTLLWRPAEAQLVESARPSPAPPYFVWDLSDSRLKSQLEPCVQMRALLAQISVTATGTSRLSQDGRSEAWLLHCRLAPSDTGASRPLGDWLIFQAEEDAAGRVSELMAQLAERYALDTAPAQLLLHALTAAGRRPDDPTPSPSLSLDPRQRADCATRAVLQQLLAAMEVNEAGLLARLDTEFLHDFRVAVRRTRSALGQIKGVLPPRTLKRFEPAFAWLGQITSTPRDLDVYLLNFEDLRAQVPQDLRAALEPLKDLIAEKNLAAQSELARQLRSTRYSRIKASWRKVLEAPTARRPRAPNARRPVSEVADERILKVFRRVLKQGKAITDDSPDEELHALRKTCKKLRYLLEFFQSLYPKDKIRALIKHLKGFQNHLGELQDLSAQIQTLYTLGQELRSQRATSSETLLAMGALLGHLDRERRKLRESFEKSFRAFSSAENHAHYRKLFSGQRGVLQNTGETRE